MFLIWQTLCLGFHVLWQWAATVGRSEGDSLTRLLLDPWCVAHIMTSTTGGDQPGLTVIITTRSIPARGTVYREVVPAVGKAEDVHTLHTPSSSIDLGPSTQVRVTSRMDTLRTGGRTARGGGQSRGHEVSMGFVDSTARSGFAW